MHWLLLTVVAVAAGVVRIVSAVEIAEIQPSDTVRLMHTLGPDTYFYANAGQSLFGLMILMLALVPFTMFCLWSDRRAESRYE